MSSEDSPRGGNQPESREVDSSCVSDATPAEAKPFDQAVTNTDTKCVSEAEVSKALDCIDEYKCAICQDLLYQPVKMPCCNNLLWYVPLKRNSSKVFI
jgi:hypothetical protein